MTVGSQYTDWCFEVEADAVGICALRFLGVGDAVRSDARCQNRMLFNQNMYHRLQDWLDIYFSGAVPDFVPPLHLVGTEFQTRVWQMLLAIPYGTTTTYGELARRLGPRMSAQAVGQAVGHNPVALVVPCHRVVAAHGLGGYAYGTEVKRRLLQHELSTLCK